MEYLAPGVRGMIGVLFPMSVVGKVAARSSWGAFVAAVGDMRVVPRTLVRPTAWLVTVVESVICLLVSLPLTAAAVTGLTLAAGLLAVLTCGIGLALRRGVRSPCHCFGRSTTPLGIPHTVRNAVLSALAGVSAVTITAPADPHPGAVVLAVAAGVTVGLLVASLDDVLSLLRPARHPAGARCAAFVEPRSCHARSERSRDPRRSAACRGSAPHLGGVIKRLREQSRLLADVDRHPGRLAVGTRIDTFETSTVEGEQLVPALLPDRMLVAFLFPGCEPCRDKLPVFVEYARRHPGGRPTVLVAVIGSPEQSAGFVSALGAVAQVVVEDHDGALSTAFQTQTYPTVLSVERDANGELVVADHQVRLDRPTAVPA
ncbi:hypothetical protein RB200_34950 [Streptomyces sp. PmtG]